ncbi:hypothetical protein CVV38_04325 [Candidatus Peregrinibacteria bacterium HGW-Peregrinibacteria-1]|jgi:hypothetical protein|nr:MAG: hypothetical protein CVV38_04325 [Candidatus Peregrinibacteria bacterium HGW-Peregrinibacteria-1]
MSNKIIYFLLGTLSASIILAVFMNTFGVTGVYLGFLLTAGLTYYLYKNAKKYHYLKAVSYGMASVLIIGVLAYILLISQTASLLN